MQTISLQFDLFSGAGTNLDAGNTEGANWPELGADQYMDTGATEIVPKKDENKPVPSCGAPPDNKIADQIPLFGTIVPSNNPSFSGVFGSSSISPKQEKESPTGFEFPPVSAPVQNPSPSGFLFHNSGTQNFVAPQVQNSPNQQKSFPNVSWKPKEP